MEITYNKLYLVNFPVFALDSMEQVDVIDGILWHGNLVIDDRNQIGETLGERRLQTPHKLFKLNTACEDLMELLQSKHKLFVDFKGYCFYYKKTKFVKVKYHKIKNVIEKDTYSLIVASETVCPIRVKRPPPIGKGWIGLIYFNKTPWLPYEYSESYCKDLRRKI